MSGMVTSIEPGYYEPDNFGIRIENLYITIDAGNHGRLPQYPAAGAGASSSGNGNDGGIGHPGPTTKPFCAFEPLTLVPIKVNWQLVDISCLSPEEVQWINDYHDKVRVELQPLMQKHFPWAVDYLIRETAHI